MLFSILGPSSLPVVVAQQPDESSAATRKLTMVGQKYYRGEGTNERLGGKNIQNIIK